MMRREVKGVLFAKQFFVFVVLIIFNVVSSIVIIVFNLLIKHKNTALKGIDSLC